MKNNITPIETIDQVQSILNTLSVLVSHDPEFLNSLAVSTHGVDTVCWILDGMKCALESACDELKHP